MGKSLMHIFLALLFMAGFFVGLYIDEPDLMLICAVFAAQERILSELAELKELYKKE